MAKEIKRLAVLRMAAGLLSEDAENSEYDRAIVELTSDLLGVTSDDRESLEAILRSLQ